MELNIEVSLYPFNPWNLVLFLVQSEYFINVRWRNEQINELRWLVCDSLSKRTMSKHIKHKEYVLFPFLSQGTSHSIQRKMSGY